MNFGEDKKKASEDAFKASAENMNEERVNEAADSADEKIRSLENSIPESLKELWEEIKTLAALLRDYVKGDYKTVPFNTVAAIAAALLYFVSPVDVVPDFIPVLGYIDDAFVVNLCIRWCKMDIQNYREWKEKSKG